MTDAPATSATHALQRAEALPTTVDDAPLDPATTEALRQAHHRHGVAITIGTLGPMALGTVLLLLDNAGVVAVPYSALLVTYAMGLLAGPLAYAMDRRAFLAECTSLGLSSTKAKELYAEHRREQRQLRLR